MRVVAFLAQCKPLCHAKAVLLVDDDEAELREIDGIFKQCVRADNQWRIRRSGRSLSSAFGFLLAARQLGDLNAQRRQPFGQLVVVLFGQQFGGGHKGHLITGLHCLAGSQCRHNRFAAADITL